MVAYMDSLLDTMNWGMLVAAAVSSNADMAVRPTESVVNTMIV